MAGPLELDGDDLDLTRWLRPGDGAFWGQHSAEPAGLVDRFIAAGSEVEGLRAFCGHTWREALSRPEAHRIEVSSYGTLGKLTRVAAERAVHVVPCHFSELPGLFARRVLPGDVALLQVAPPDRSGRCSYGVDAGYVADAVTHARVVIAEINERMPATPGAGVAFTDLDAVVRVDRALPLAPPPRISDVDAAIAEHVAGLIADGDTLQLGVGALPTAILDRLGHLEYLAIHSGMISDPVVDLIEAGVITGTRKPADHGLAVTGAALGSTRLFDFLSSTDAVRLLPASYTHRPDVLARTGHLVAINGAIEVDLTGQVNAEAVGDRYIGGVGGQVDFLRAAATNGGVGIIALPSLVAKAGTSRIVARLSGPVTTARSDVDVVVTEHGVAHLRGLDLDSRAEALIAIAHPDQRDDLERARRS